MPNDPELEAVPTLEKNTKAAPIGVEGRWAAARGYTCEASVREAISNWTDMNMRLAERLCPDFEEANIRLVLKDRTTHPSATKATITAYLSSETEGWGERDNFQLGRITYALDQKQPGMVLLQLENSGAAMEADSFNLGGGLSEKEKRSIGRIGEGLKLGAWRLLAAGCHWEVTTNGVMVRYELDDDGRVLRRVTANGDSLKFQKTTVSIRMPLGEGGTSYFTNLLDQRTFLRLTAPPAEEVFEAPGEGCIMKPGVGRVYVAGVLVCTDPHLKEVGIDLNYSSADATNANRTGLREDLQLSVLLARVLSAALVTDSAGRSARLALELLSSLVKEVQGDGTTARQPRTPWLIWRAVNDLDQDAADAVVAAFAAKAAADRSVVFLPTSASREDVAMAANVMGKKVYLVDNSMQGEMRDLITDVPQLEEQFRDALAADAPAAPADDAERGILEAVMKAAELTALVRADELVLARADSMTTDVFYNAKDKKFYISAAALSKPDALNEIVRNLKDVANKALPRAEYEERMAATVQFALQADQPVLPLNEDVYLAAMTDASSSLASITAHSDAPAVLAAVLSGIAATIGAGHLRALGASSISPGLAAEAVRLAITVPLSAKLEEITGTPGGSDGDQPAAKRPKMEKKEEEQHQPAAAAEAAEMAEAE